MTTFCLEFHMSPDEFLKLRYRHFKLLLSGLEKKYKTDRKKRDDLKSLREIGKISKSFKFKEI